MKKIFIILALCINVMSAWPQGQDPYVYSSNEEAVEEPDYSSTSLEEIISIQQKLTDSNAQQRHFQSVWSRKGFFNISFNSVSLNSKKALSTGLESNIESFKSNWGVGIQYGRNYSLLKNPIINMLMVNLDYCPLDLNISHFKRGSGNYLYNSELTVGEDKFYLPWTVEKFQYDYGMSLGPSLTIAPFTKLNISELHFLKFNVYYHIGYHISLLQFKTKDNEDANTTNSKNKNNMSEALKLNFGHGLTNCIGFNVSWKAIGIGYEMRWASLQYQSLDKENFGSDKYKFSTPTSRVFLEIRM